MVFSKDTKKVNIMATVPVSLQSKLGAADWAKQVAERCGGKGGGKQDVANASGELSKFNDAFQTASHIATTKLS